MCVAYNVLCPWLCAGNAEWRTHAQGLSSGCLQVLPHSCVSPQSLRMLSQNQKSKDIPMCPANSTSLLNETTWVTVSGNTLPGCVTLGTRTPPPTCKMKTWVWVICRVPSCVLVLWFSYKTSSLPPSAHFHQFPTSLRINQVRCDLLYFFLGLE